MRKFVIIFGLAGILLYLFLNYNFNEQILAQGVTYAKNIKYNTQNNLKDDGYFVNLTGCKIPSFDFRYGRTSNDLISLPHPPIRCNNTLTNTQNNFLYRKMEKSEIEYLYNITNIENISCIYQPFYRKNDNHNEYGNSNFIFNLSKAVKLKSENYIRVMCNLNKTNTFYENFHYPGINNNISTKVNNNHKISVMVIGFKDLTHYNFLRKMRKTTKCLRNESFLSVEYFGLNRIGKSNFDNFIPFLSGFNEEELIASCLHPYQNQSYDQCPFIWKVFRENGFRTLFAEDVAHLGLFNYVRPGFLYPPTDYYTRPIIVEFEKLLNNSKMHNKSLLPCSKINLSIDFILQTIYNFIPQYLTYTFFSFYLFTSSNFNSNNIPHRPYLMDNEIYNLILKLKDTKVLNKTILFFISDRGKEIGSYKNTYQGIMEERQPLLIVVVPKWFENTYSHAINNLKTNARKLTTHFDVHETLLDLTDLSTISNNHIFQRSKEILENDIFPRGISLFLNIPNQRTCEHAGIAYNWCTCYEKQILPTNKPKMQKAARYIIHRLNEKIRDFPQCRTLHLNSILYASISSANKKVLKGIEGEYISEITIRIQTKPGLAEYEAIIRMTPYLSFLVGNITRINYNGKHSFCVSNNNLKAYCYCLR